MTASTYAEIVKQSLTDQIYTFWLKRYRAYLEDREDLAELWMDHKLTQEQQQGLPEEVLQAFNFYDETVMQQDWGSVRIFQLEVAGQSIYVVDTVTDGDDGWLEAYSTQGDLLGAARRYIELLTWKELAEIRDSVAVGSFPEELDRTATLWGKPLPETQS
jgi:hypothetical protein